MKLNFKMLEMQNNDKDEKEKLDYKTFVFEETKYKTLFTKKFETRTPWLKPDEKKIFSFLPGTAKKIPISKGSKVDKGDIILVFEAMKMMNTIRSEQKGTIKSVLVKPGDKFPKNQLLIEFE
jgi:biotin carboxyl carrier protein